MPLSRTFSWRRMYRTRFRQDGRGNWKGQSSLLVAVIPHFAKCENGEHCQCSCDVSPSLLCNPEGSYSRRSEIFVKILGRREIERSTSNIQHPTRTSNTARYERLIGSWMLDVWCWMFCYGSVPAAPGWGHSALP